MNNSSILCTISAMNFIELFLSWVLGCYIAMRSVRAFMKSFFQSFIQDSFGECHNRGTDMFSSFRD